MALQKNGFYRYVTAGSLSIDTLKGLVRSKKQNLEIWLSAFSCPRTPQRDPLVRRCQVYNPDVRKMEGTACSLSSMARKQSRFPGARVLPDGLVSANAVRAIVAAGTVPLSLHGPA